MKRRRGFLTVMAVLVLALVGSAVLLMARAAAADAGRERNEHDQAQLRELRAVGVVRARAGGTATVEVPVPAVLRDAGGGVSVRFDKDGAEVRARYDGHVTTERVSTSDGHGGG